MKLGFVARELMGVFGLSRLGQWMGGRGESREGVQRLKSRERSGEDGMGRTEKGSNVWAGERGMKGD